MERAKQGPDLPQRFIETIIASIAFAPLALLLAGANTAFLYYVLGALPLPGALFSWLVLLWGIASHALFITFLCAFSAMPGARPGPRFKVALRVGFRGMPAMALTIAIGLALALIAPLAAVVAWAAGCYFALPARFVDHGWPGPAAFAKPLPVPPAHRAALLAPTVLLLAAATWLLRGFNAGLMDGGMFLGPFAAFVLFWAAFGAAIFSAHFAWEGKA